MTQPLPVLILKTGSTHAPIRERLGDFEDWIAAGLGKGGALAITHHAQAGKAPPPLDSVAGIVITGSHAMVSDREPWSEALVPWLRDAVAASVPTLGICYGHQLLAHALGGDVAHHPDGVEIGTVQVRLREPAAEDPLLGQLPATFNAQAVHWQSVRRLPTNAVPLASSDHENHHAFRVGRNAWGVQFHPEFSAGALRAYLDGLGPTLATQGLDATQISAGLKDTPEAASVLATFARVALAA